MTFTKIGLMRRHSVAPPKQFFRGPVPRALCETPATVIEHFPVKLPLFPCVILSLSKDQFCSAHGRQPNCSFDKLRMTDSFLRPADWKNALDRAVAATLRAEKASITFEIRR
jgi:hypothetical protein